MLLHLLLTEMAAKKLCDKCGKSMAANHYWYKGGWKCKGGSKADADPQTLKTDGVVDAEVQPSQVVDKQPTATTQQPVAVPTDQSHNHADSPSVAVEAQPLEITLTIIDEAIPLLNAELEKINKIAKRVGANEITTETLSTSFKEVTKKQTLDGVEQVRNFMQKVHEIRLTGTTPRIKGADGTTWDFIGVITPSATGQAILKLTPSAGDSEGVRRLYSANPYYCDYCRTVRRRNETFIVQNGTNYRQVGRNCLKDFVGGANPQALLQFFSWFSDSEHLEKYLYSAVVAGGDEDDTGWGGGSGRSHQYYRPLEVLKLTLASVKLRGAYHSAKSEVVRTASDVRNALFNLSHGHLSEEEVKFRRAVIATAKEADIETQAEDVITWFKSLPQTEIDSNTFLKNVSIMIGEDAVESRQVGYIVGLYPAWERARQQQSEKPTNGVKLVKEWPTEWGTESRVVENEHAVVKYVRAISGVYGTSLIIYLMLDNGLGVSWKYSGRNSVKEGDEFNLTGELQPDAYFNPPRIKFVPSRKWLRSAFADNE